MGAVTELEHPPSIPAPTGEAALPVPSARTRKRFLTTLALLLLGLIVAGVLRREWWFAQPTTPVIAVSGRIEGREVSLAAKAIQGRVRRLLVDEGQTVTQGQLLAELDAAQIDAQRLAAAETVASFDAQIRQASLDVSYAARSSAASIAAADAGLSNAQAHVERAAAVLANARAAYDRASSLYTDHVIARQELDQAEMARRTSEADLAAAEKDVAHAEASLALARTSTDTIELKRQQLRALQASRRSAAARVVEADANRAERQIVAPSNGTVLSRPVEIGDVVSPGTPLFALVDMNRLYVKVYVPEPDIAKLRLGREVTVRVDAFPDRRFTGHVSRIYDQAEFTPKNVETTEERLKLVFGVEVALDNSDGILKPGMPADCEIPVAEHTAEPSGHGR